MGNHDFAPVCWSAGRRARGRGLGEGERGPEPALGAQVVPAEGEKDAQDEEQRAPAVVAERGFGDGEEECQQRQQGGHSEERGEVEVFLMGVHEGREEPRIRRGKCT